MRKVPISICFTTAFLLLAALYLGCPASIRAGSPDSSNPGEPGKQRLEQSPQTFSAENIVVERFEMVYDGTAVLDRETGIAWELSPDPMTMSWEEAVNYCDSLELAGKQQWHLATIEELASLVDASVLGSPKLPANHLFDTGCRLGGCVQASTYWSGTPCDDNAAQVWLVCFCNGKVARTDKNDTNYAWCARDKNTAGTD